jgi:hypothetical protein
VQTGDLTSGRGWGLEEGNRLRRLPRGGFSRKKFPSLSTLLAT